MTSDWQKFDYLLEFGQWLYCNEFPLVNAINQVEWAVDILLNMKFEVEQKKETLGMVKYCMFALISAKSSFEMLHLNYCECGADINHTEVC